MERELFNWSIRSIGARCKTVCSRQVDQKLLYILFHGLRPQLTLLAAFCAFLITCDPPDSFYQCNISIPFSLNLSLSLCSLSLKMLRPPSLFPFLSLSLSSHRLLDLHIMRNQSHIIHTLAGIRISLGQINLHILTHTRLFQLRFDSYFQYLFIFLSLAWALPFHNAKILLIFHNVCSNSYKAKAISSFHKMAS